MQKLPTYIYRLEITPATPFQEQLLLGCMESFMDFLQTPQPGMTHRNNKVTLTTEIVGNGGLASEVIVPERVAESIVRGLLV